MRGLVLGVLVAAMAGCGRVGEPLPEANTSVASGVTPAAPSGAGAQPANPTTNPATTNPMRSPTQGVTLTVGTVVAEANGQPIYADKVLAQLESPLAAKARERNMTPALFRSFAQELIHKKVLSEISSELEFAAAQQNLDEDKRRLATALTIEWRRKRVAEASGSEAIAQARMLSETGLTLDEAVQRQYREFMGRIYYETKVTPLAAVSADEMRAFYDANRNEFIQAAQIQFRVIKVKIGDDVAAAQQKINEAHTKAINGHDFAELARMYNDDPNLKQNAGLEPWVGKGNYVAAPPVEEAAWKLDLRGLSAPIQHNGAWYLTRLEDRKLETSAPFDDPKVQEAIKNKLWAEKFDRVRKIEQTRLWNNGYKRFSEPMLNTAVDMAMQKYSQWAGSKG